MFLEFYENFLIFMYMYVLYDFYLMWLSTVFWRAKHGYEWRERASIYMKRKNKNKHGGETFVSRVPITAILLFVPKKCSSKNAKKCVKKILLSSCPDEVKLRSQFTVFIAPTSKREDSRDRTQRKSQNSHGALFMVGGFALSFISD